ncbi:MAG TPA: histidine kinase [Bradyrhizobium sp.]|uniref:histidine kinase n=1 Tax=Bradyrhizobium sp. TaxID=376 RepID=UPI002BE5E8E6|nr:histidine kinase [Bradyrhizobium sp.]HLZ01768.1 histidine kinase [Bradyrhizobium sp.]
MMPSSPESADERMRRAAIVGQLAGGIIHDFNNVLTVITGMIDILSEAVADKPQLAAVTRLIDEAASRGAALTSRLLAFARGLPAQPTEVDVSALLDETSRLLRPTLGGIEMAVVTPADLPPALADAGQVMAAVLSLAIAACNAMPEGGALTLTAEMRRIQTGAAASGATRGADQDAIVIALHAHGYGDAAQHPDQIFTEVGMAEEFVAPSAGHVVILAPAGTNACVEILLPKASDTPAWLADS